MCTAFNHFTVDVSVLRSVDSLPELIAVLEAEGYSLLPALPKNWASAISAVVMTMSTLFGDAKSISSGSWITINRLYSGIKCCRISKNVVFPLLVPPARHIVARSC